jgi:hypothetical protein
MIVRFDFETDVVTIVESNHSGIVFKYAYAPIVRPEFAPNLVGRGKDRLLEHILKATLALFVSISDPPAERLMAAMFAPRLCNRL